MRALVQRVSRAHVEVDGQVVGSIGTGLLALVGVGEGDTHADASAIGDKLVGLRVFGDEKGAMNLSLRDVGGQVLVVSQFTLYGDVRRGRRPSYTRAARPEHAEPLVEMVAARVSGAGIGVATGTFGALMKVELVNEGPVTLLVESSGGRLV